MRRVLSEALMSAGAVALLLVALVWVDPRVREQIALHVPSNTAALAAGEQRASHLARTIIGAARDQGLEHAPLVIFTMAASVLVLFMLRT